MLEFIVIENYLKKNLKITNGIELVYTPSIETKYLSQLYNLFFFIYSCLLLKVIIVLVIILQMVLWFIYKILEKKTCINVDGLEWL